MESRKEIAEILYKSAFKFFKLFSHRTTSITFREVHLTPELRVDILNISYDEKVVIIELKTCRADFVGDSKWKKYLNYCDRFMFMCPDGVIKPEELPNNIGLVYVYLNKDKKEPFIKIIRKPQKLKPIKLNSAWFKYTFKKLAFKKFAIFNNKLISVGVDNFFN